jgi:Flp pilus assembly protein TadB
MIIRKNVLALFFLLFVTAYTVKAAVIVLDNNPPKEKREALTEEQKARLQALQNRVAQIKAVDKSTLSKSDRKELSRELKDLKKEARRMSGKSFVIVLGVLIVAILLLLLLLF